MRVLLALAMAGLFVGSAQGQSIEGYWQDIAGRITYKHNPQPGDKYGDWYPRSLDATYPSAKHFRRVGSTYEVADLNYDERDYAIRVIRASEREVDFVRQAKWSPCRVDHSCRLTGSEMLCTMTTVCVEHGKEYVDLRAEERFVRRTSCVRGTTKPQAQGFPVICN